MISKYNSILDTGKHVFCLVLVLSASFFVPYKLYYEKKETIITVKDKSYAINWDDENDLYTYPTSNIITATDGRNFYNKTSLMPFKLDRKSRFIDAQLKVGKTYKITTHGNKFLWLGGPNIHKVTEVTK